MSILLPTAPGDSFPERSDLWNTLLSVSRREFENPVEQVMFILGFKHDPRFHTALDAMRTGSNPGIINALEQLTVYGAIDANFSGMRLTMEKIHEHFGSNPPLSVRESVYEIIVEEMGEKQYGGKWFSTVEEPSEHWVNLGAYSPVFQRGGTESSVYQRHILICRQKCSSDVIPN